MIGRVGVDLVPYHRAQQLIDESPGTLRHMLSPGEITLSTNAFGVDVAAVAGRRAAQEAFFNLLHLHGESVPWSRTEIVKNPGGWPEVVLTGRSARLAARAGIDDVSVSITHDDGYAMAVAYAAPALTHGGCDHEFGCRKAGRGAGLDPAQAP